MFDKSETYNLFFEWDSTGFDTPAFNRSRNSSLGIRLFEFRTKCRFLHQGILRIFPFLRGGVLLAPTPSIPVCTTCIQPTILTSLIQVHQIWVLRWIHFGTQICQSFLYHKSQSRLSYYGIQQLSLIVDYMFCILTILYS